MGGVANGKIGTIGRKNVYTFVFQKCNVMCSKDIDYWCKKKKEKYKPLLLLVLQTYFVEIYASNNLRSFVCTYVSEGVLD